MQLKLDSLGHVVTEGDKPVYVHADGREIPFDAASAMAKIGQLNGEAKNNRERAEAAHTKLKTFDGIDPAAALRALGIVKNLDQKALLDAGEVERIRADTAAEHESRLKALRDAHKPVEQDLIRLRGQTAEMHIGQAFANSQFIAGRALVPIDMLRATFGSHFKFEGGQVVAYDESGNQMYSRERPGQLAGFDEALSQLVNAYPHRDSILRHPGARPVNPRPGAGALDKAKVLTRSAFDKLEPDARMAHVMAGGTLVD